MIKVLPHNDSDEPNHVGIRLYVSYPPKYPDEIAKFRVEIIKGLKDKQAKELQELAISLSEENVGAPAMFTVCTELQEWLVQNNIPSDTSLHDQMKAQQELKARLQRLTFGDESKEDDHTAADVHADFDLSYKRAKGTPVTKKSFAKWAKKFIAEYRAKKQAEFLEKFGSDDKRDKLTGVEIFQLKAQEKMNMDEDNEDDNGGKKKKKKAKTVVVGDNAKNSDFKNDDKTVVISDESLFLDMDMPDF